MVTGVSMEECLRADRCESGLKPHIYLGDNDDVMMDMFYNFEPLVKLMVGGKLYIERNQFIRVGLKMIEEDTSVDLMGFADEDYDEVGNIFSKFHIWSLDNEDYQERKQKMLENSLRKMGPSKMEQEKKRILLEFDEKEYQNYIKTPDYKRVGGVKDDDKRLFFLSELFLRKMHGTTKK